MMKLHILEQGNSIKYYNSVKFYEMPLFFRKEKVDILEKTCYNKTK